ncbi:MAG: hypothetical protein AAFQ04_07490 [Pseudomonadota bacterium]
MVRVSNNEAGMSTQQADQTKKEETKKIIVSKQVFSDFAAI